MSTQTNEQFVLIVGDDLDNTITIGPFEQVEDATMFAEIECRNEVWHVAILYPVRKGVLT